MRGRCIGAIAAAAASTNCLLVRGCRTIGGCTCQRLRFLDVNVVRSDEFTLANEVLDRGRPLEPLSYTLGFPYRYG
jgi:hypothetical protein